MIPNYCMFGFLYNNFLKGAANTRDIQHIWFSREVKLQDGVCALSLVNSQVYSKSIEDLSY